MQTHEWSLQDAKNKFSAVVDAAQNGEAQNGEAQNGEAQIVTLILLQIYKRGWKNY